MHICNLSLTELYTQAYVTIYLFVYVCGTASHTSPSTYSPCPSICIFKYTRKSRSITDANKLNERRKIHKYKVPTVCFHLNWNWSLRTASQQLQHGLESPASTSTSTSAPQTNKGSQQEAEKEQQQQESRRPLRGRRRQCQVKTQTHCKHELLSDLDEDDDKVVPGDFHCFVSL